MFSLQPYLLVYYCNPMRWAVGGLQHALLEGYCFLLAKTAREAQRYLWVAVGLVSYGRIHQVGERENIYYGTNSSIYHTWYSCFFHQFSFLFLPLYIGIPQNSVLNPVLSLYLFLGRPHIIPCLKLLPVWEQHQLVNTLKLIKMKAQHGKSC